MSLSNTSYHSLSNVYKNRTVVEEFIATMNNNLNAHNAKWQAHKNQL